MMSGKESNRKIRSTTHQKVYLRIGIRIRRSCLKHYGGCWEALPRHVPRRLRKTILQTGLVIIGLAVASEIAGGLLFGPGVIMFSFPMAFFGLALVLIGAIMPRPKGEKWGSMFPLVGYDRGYDNMVVRGPWQRRLDEMDEQKKRPKKKP
jgi:hypothetical protein